MLVGLISGGFLPQKQTSLFDFKLLCGGAGSCMWEIRVLHGFYLTLTDLVQHGLPHMPLLFEFFYHWFAWIPTFISQISPLSQAVPKEKIFEAGRHNKQIKLNTTRELVLENLLRALSIRGSRAPRPAMPMPTAATWIYPVLQFLHSFPGILHYCIVCQFYLLCCVLLFFRPVFSVTFLPV